MTDEAHTRNVMAAILFARKLEKTELWPQEKNEEARIARSLESHVRAVYKIVDQMIAHAKATENNQGGTPQL